MKKKVIRIECSGLIDGAYKIMLFQKIRKYLLGILRFNLIYVVFFIFYVTLGS